MREMVGAEGSWQGGWRDYLESRLWLYHRAGEGRSADWNSGQGSSSVLGGGCAWCVDGGRVTRLYVVQRTSF